VTGSPLPPGRRPAATRKQVLEAARRAFVAGDRVDVQQIAAQLGLGRVSVYRWYGNREGLLSAVILDWYRAEFDRALLHCAARGAPQVFCVCDYLMRAYEQAEPMHEFVAREPVLARRLLTSPDGAFHQEKVTTIRELIEGESGVDGWAPPVEPRALAYVAVHLVDDLNFSDPAHGLQGNRAQLLTVLRALLGMPPEVRESNAPVPAP
jgi:AcrR family transcriptional regulator